MIRIDKETYSPYCEENDPAYPGGKAVPAPTGNSIAGTPWRASLFNQMIGFFQATIVEAFGSYSISGEPDKVGQSEVLSALNTIAARIASQEITPELILSRLKTVDGINSGLDADYLGGRPADYYLDAGIGFFVKAISGIETVIPFTELSYEEISGKRFCIIVTASGNYPEFISFNAEMEEDGLHVRPVRLIGGELIPGTRSKKWGESKWGSGGEFVSAKKWGVGKWGESVWGGGRWISGDMWGAYAPMYINIVIKEI
jgi:hypothetical protein